MTLTGTGSNCRPTRMARDDEGRRIRYLAVEREELIEHRVRAAVITNANLSASAMTKRVLRVIPDLARICADRPVPFLFAI